MTDRRTLTIEQLVDLWWRRTISDGAFYREWMRRIGEPFWRRLLWRFL